MTLDLPSPEFLRKILDYDPDTGRFAWKSRTLDMFSAFPDPERDVRWFEAKAGKPALTTKIHGYLCGRLFLHPIKDRAFLAHRVAWVMMSDRVLQPKEWVCHINRQRDDNRFMNLKVTGGSAQ